MEGTTIWRKMITEMRGADLMVCRINEICKEYNLMRFYFFELIKNVKEKNSSRNFSKLQMSFLFGREGRWPQMVSTQGDFCAELHTMFGGDS